MFTNRECPGILNLTLSYYLVMILFLVNTSAGLPHQDNRENGMDNQILVLLFLDFADFNCPLCLDSFLDFCRMLPPHNHGVSIWGIVVNSEDIENSPDAYSVQILGKKIRGFTIANNLDFPLILDRSHIITKLINKGSQAILLNPNGRIFERYTFPLDPQSIQKIHQFLHFD